MKLSSLTMIEMQDLEARAAARQPLSRTEAERVLASADLVAVGVLGETARKATHGDRVTFGRVAIVRPGALPAERGEAGEVRLEGKPASLEEARARVREAITFARGVPLTGFSLVDLDALAHGDPSRLTEIAAMLREDGLEAVSAPLDELGNTDHVVALVQAVTSAGVGVWRAIVDQSTPEVRLDLIDRAAVVQRETGAFRAFAPLARSEPRDAPSTGYDDVRTIAVARLVCQAIASIQVDWSLYGPKLAQVAIAYGTDDLDAVSPVDLLQLGHRRSPAEDVRRQIAAAFAEPGERNGRYEPIS